MPKLKFAHESVPLINPPNPLPSSSHHLHHVVRRQPLLGVSGWRELCCLPDRKPSHRTQDQDHQQREQRKATAPCRFWIVKEEMNTLDVSLSVCARSLNRCSVTFTAQRITGSQWTFGYFAVVLRRKHDAVGGEQAGAHHAAI